MSADPPPPAGLSHTAAAEPAAAAASTPAAGTKRRAGDDASAALNAVEHQGPSGSSVDGTPPAAVGPSSTVLAAAHQTAPAASSAAHSTSDATARKKQRLAPSASAAAPAVAAPPWSRLYSDALHSIFQFTSLADLTRLMSVSRRWEEAVMTTPPIAASVTISADDRRAQLIGLLNSRVRRHVSSLSGGSHSPYWIYSSSLLQSISTQTPWLTELSLQFPTSHPLTDETEAWCAALARFNKLRALCVSPDPSVYWRWDPDLGQLSSAPILAYNRILQTIGGLESVTMLGLHLPSSRQGISFAPLAALTRLRRLSFSISYGPHPLSLTDAQINELRALTSVQQLLTPYRGPGQTDFFVRMLQPGHALHLTTLGDYAATQISAPLAAVLGSLPTLARLCAELQCPDVRFLSSLTALTDVDLSQAEVSVDPAELAASLRHCSQIIRLKLARVALTDRDLGELLSAFPLLSTLTLMRLDQLDSLRCFSTPALAASLTSLELRSLECSTTEIIHLFGLRSLRSLHIGGLAEPLTDAQRAELRPRSQRFPQLKRSERQKAPRLNPRTDLGRCVRICVRARVAIQCLCRTPHSARGPHRRRPSTRRAEERTAQSQQSAFSVVDTQRVAVV